LFAMGCAEWLAEYSAGLQANRRLNQVNVL